LTSILAGKGFVREYGGAATVALASVIPAFSGELQFPQISPVITDRERRANFHCALAGVYFFGRFRLFEAINYRLVAIVRDQIPRFLQTHSEKCAQFVSTLPRSRCILRLLTELSAIL
jgi:hypothetical protein